MTTVSVQHTGERRSSYPPRSTLILRVLLSALVLLSVARVVAALTR